MSEVAGASVHAILFDVGGPLDTEHTRECVIDAHVMEACREAGLPGDAVAFSEAERWAVDTFASDAWRQASCLFSPWKNQ